MNREGRQRRTAWLVLMLWMAAAIPGLHAQNARKAAEKQRRQLAKEEKKYDDLQQHLPSQKGIKQAQTLAELARLDYDFAHAEYTAGHAAQGERYLLQSRNFAAQAMQVLKQEAAHGHTNGMKKVEMAFQQISFGLHDLAFTVDVAHRPPIEAARNYFSSRRAEVLALMFAPKKKK